MRLPDLQWFDPVRGQFIRQRTVAGITAENTADFYCAGLVFGLGRQDHAQFLFLRSLQKVLTVFILQITGKFSGKFFR